MVENLQDVSFTSIWDRLDELVPTSPGYDKNLKVFQVLAQNVVDAHWRICRSYCYGGHLLCGKHWLSQHFREWLTWGDLETLWNWRSIYTDLCAKYDELNPSDLEKASPGLDKCGLGDLLDKVLDSPQRQQLLESRGENAIAVVDLLQILVDFEHWNSPDRPSRAKRFERVLKKIAGHSGVLPRYLFLSGVERLGQNPLTGGGFADIYQGRVQGHLVGLKVLRVFTTEQADSKLRKELCKEALIWRQFYHPYILPFYGVCDDIFHPRLCLVSPWMNNGNIMNYLSNNQSAKRYPLVKKIAQGLCYLHGLKPPVAHGDLRGANVFITDKGWPQIADFGISEVVDSYVTGGTATCNTRGSTRWMAPEFFDWTRSEFLTARIESDVYSFACLCIEVFSGNPPFDTLREGAVPVAILSGRRPERSPETIARGLSNLLWQIMQECWRTDPKERPTMPEVFERLVMKPYHEDVTFAWGWSARPYDMMETLASLSTESMVERG